MTSSLVTMWTKKASISTLPFEIQETCTRHSSILWKTICWCSKNISSIKLLLNEVIQQRFTATTLQQITSTWLAKTLTSSKRNTKVVYQTRLRKIRTRSSSWSSKLWVKPNSFKSTDSSRKWTRMRSMRRRQQSLKLQRLHPSNILIQMHLSIKIGNRNFISE